jgi:NAD(P)-dependent dehydrogenase (short-subunit alcohol dehydrogenase family)
MNGLKGKVAVVTGGARDIGRAISVRLAAEGAKVCINYCHNENKALETLELVRKAGGRIVKEPQDAFWGGYHAYFSDPDGYYWEVVWGPDFRFDENGLLVF